MRTKAELKKCVGTVFAALCEHLGVKPIDTSLGVRSSASFATEREAELLRTALVSSKAPNVDVHHWPASDCPDFEQDEWQVSWGDL